MNFFCFFLLFNFIFINSNALKNHEKKPKSVVVAGSYRKFLKEVQNTIVEFEKNKIEVLAPKISNPYDLDSEFVMINAENDKNKNPKDIEIDFLNKIEESDILYVVNVNGYIGLATSMEIGYAYAIGKPIYCSELPIDFQHKMFCSVKNIKDLLH